MGTVAKQNPSQPLFPTTLNSASTQPDGLTSVFLCGGFNPSQTYESKWIIDSSIQNICEHKQSIMKITT